MEPSSCASGGRDRTQTPTPPGARTSAHLREDLEQQLTNRPLACTKPLTAGACAKVAAAGPVDHGMRALAAIISHPAGDRGGDRSEQMAAPVTRSHGRGDLSHRSARELKTARCSCRSNHGHGTDRDGYDHGRAILDDYGIGTDAGWVTVTLHAPVDEQQTACGENWAKCSDVRPRRAGASPTETSRRPAAPVEQRPVLPPEDQPRLLAKRRTNWWRCCGKAVHWRAGRLRACSMTDELAVSVNDRAHRSWSIYRGLPDHFSFFVRGMCHEIGGTPTAGACVYHSWPPDPWALTTGVARQHLRSSPGRSRLPALWSAGRTGWRPC